MFVKIATKSIEKNNKEKLLFTKYASVLMFTKIIGFQVVSVEQEVIDYIVRKAEFTMCASDVCHHYLSGKSEAYSKNFQQQEILFIFDINYRILIGGKCSF